MLKSSTADRVPMSVRLGFGLSALATLAAQQILSVLGLRFMTDNLAIPAGVAGGVFALIQIWDGFVHPAIGYASDNSRSRWGRRLPFMLLGSIVLPLAVAAFFAPPSLPSMVAMVAFITLALMVHGVGYSLVLVPVQSMSVEVTDGYHQRSDIATFKAMGGFFGSILGSTVPPWLLVFWGPGRAGNAAMGMSVGGLIAAIGLFSVFLLRKARATHATSTDRLGFFRQAKVAWSNRPFRTIVIVHVMFMVGVATASSSNAFFTRHVLHRTDAWLGLFYIFLTLGNMIAIPAWLWASKRFDKKQAYLAALLFYGITEVLWGFSGPWEPLWMLSLQDVINGTAMSGVVLLANSILTDAVRHDYIQTGERREGAFSGFISLIDKISGAVGIAVMGFLLSQMGYVSSASGHSAPQSAAARWAVIISFSAIPALTAFISVFLMRYYTLKEEDLLEEVRVEIAEGRRARD